MDKFHYSQDSQLVVSSYIHHMTHTDDKWLNIGISPDILQLLIKFYDDADAWDTSICPPEFQICGAQNEFIKRKRNTIHFAYRSAFGTVTIGPYQKKIWKFKVVSMPKIPRAYPNKFLLAIFGIVNVSQTEVLRKRSQRDQYACSMDYDFTCVKNGGFGFASDGVIWNGTAKGRRYAVSLVKGDVVEMELDATDPTQPYSLRYYVNGVDYGVAFGNIAVTNVKQEYNEYQMAFAMQDDFVIQLMQ